jgi:arylsulfatase A-like enzyme
MKPGRDTGIVLNRRHFLQASAAGLAVGAGTAAPQTPNVLWITGDDLGPQLGCYGFPLVQTPNIDRLAGEGVRFTQAFTTAPVCSASRSAFNTGMYQTSTGTHHHRSHRKDGYRLPEGVRLITDYMRDQGYFTANVVDVAPGVKGNGKTDFNFVADKPYDGTHWRQRKEGQPFFAHVNFMAPHKGSAFVAARKQANLIDPKTVPLPPYWPDDPVVRDEYANYLDAINLLDKQVGAVLTALEADGLANNTLVFFFGDNGRCLIRGKQWLYDAGIQIPMIVRWPGQVTPGSVRKDPVSAIDMTATSIAAAGAKIPANMHGRMMFGKDAKPREAIFAARDRCDMTEDRIRCVRDSRFKYIRNFMPDRPYTQHNDYIEKQYPTLGVMKRSFAEGKLNATQSLFMQPRKPEVEFYDIVADPHEVTNLAGSPKYSKEEQRMARLLDRWMKETNDLGRTPEPRESYAASQERD